MRAAVSAGTRAQRELAEIGPHLEALAEAAERTGELLLLARIDNQSLRLRPGMACVVVLPLPEIRAQHTIPLAALSERSGETVVTFVRDGRAYEEVVRLGVRTADGVELLECPEEFELVAIEGGYALPSGYPVEVIP